MITVLGATGHIGSRIAKNLAAREEKFRVVVRSPDKLDPAIRAKAEIKVGDAQNVAFLTEALKGSDAVFALIPPNFAAADFRRYQDEFGAALTEALAKAQVKKIVFLSSIAAHLPEKTGPIVGSHRQEVRMKKQLPQADVLFLRPAYFMENLLNNVALIKAQGINGSIILPDVKLHMVATADIGDIATEKLLARDFKGFSVLGVQGPERVSMTDATRAIGEAIGNPGLKYVAFPVDAAIGAMTQAGLTRDMAEQYAEMSVSMNDGTISDVDSPTAKGKVSIQEFAKSTIAPLLK